MRRRLFARYLEEEAWQHERFQDYCLRVYNASGPPPADGVDWDVDPDPTPEPPRKKEPSFFDGDEEWLEQERRRADIH